MATEQALTSRKVAPCPYTRDMRYVLVGVLAVFMVGCDSGGVAGPASPGAAGTTGGASGGAGTGASAGTTGSAGTGAAGAAGAEVVDPCHPRSTCTPDRAAGEARIDVGTSSKEYSSPTCPGRICVPCLSILQAGGWKSKHDCTADSIDGTHAVYCDNSKPLVPGTDCN